MDDDGSGNRASDLVLNARRDGISRLETTSAPIVPGVKCCESVTALATLVE